MLRSYSLSVAPSLERYRVSVKREPHGVASAYLCDHARAGDVVEVSAPRGAFTLREGEGPVVLLSAGVGATPVLAMLHVLAAEASRREVWWLFGGRNRDEHPFREESRGLLRALVGRALSRPLQQATSGGRARDRFRRPRTPQHRRTRGGGGSPRCRLLPVRPSRVPARPDRRPRGVGRRPRPDPYRGVRARRVDDAGDRARCRPHAAPTPRTARTGTARLLRQERARRPVEPIAREPARARGGLRRASRGGRAARASATTARAGSSRDRWATTPSRSTHPRPAACSSAARGPPETWSSISERAGGGAALRATISTPFRSAPGWRRIGEGVPGALVLPSLAPFEGAC